VSHYCFLYVGEERDMGVFELVIQQSVAFVSMLYLDLQKR
jgi:hypothetical protein